MAATEPFTIDPTSLDVGDELTLRLLDAAAEVFAERGYEGAGVAEIARRAGVTTGAIYSRFSGKAELLASAIDRHSDDELDALFADHRFQGRMEDIIRIAGSHLVRLEPSPTSALLLQAFVAAGRHPDVAALLRERMLDRSERLAEVIRAAQASGGIDAALDIDALVTFCHAVGFGFLLFEAVSLPVPGPEPWETLIGRLVSAVAPVPDPPDPRTLPPTDPPT